jgi:molybdate transport system substrate-binding protein
MLGTKKRIFSSVCWLLLSLLLVVSCNRAITTNHLQIFKETTTPTKSLTISIAATLKDAMEEIKLLYGKHNPKVNLIYNFAASGTLQQQIEQGAPFDIFFSGGSQQMDALEQKGLLLDGTRKNLLKNRMVLIVPKNSTTVTDIKDLTSDRIKKIAIGEPRSTTIGQSSQEVLTSLSIQDRVKAKAIYAKDVRQVVRYVESGNVDAGLVFYPDAKSSRLVKLVQIIPENHHSPIILPVAVLKGSKNAQAAKDFIQFLSIDQAKTVFKKQGFAISSLFGGNTQEVK